MLQSLSSLCHLCAFVSLVGIVTCGLVTHPCATLFIRCISIVLVVATSQRERGPKIEMELQAVASCPRRLFCISHHKLDLLILLSSCNFLWLLDAPDCMKRDRRAESVGRWAAAVAIAVCHWRADKVVLACSVHHYVRLLAETILTHLFILMNSSG